VKNLKYHQLIANNSLNNCPDNECNEMETDAFRWVYEDISNELNYLPTFLYNEKQNRPQRKNSTDDMKCSMCALSFYVSQEKAKEAFVVLPLRVREMLGYTHLGYINISKDMGLVNFELNGHLDLFEYENIDLSGSFSIIGALN